MSKYKDKLSWCLSKHTLMTKIPPNKELSEEHLNKAKHNLKAAAYNIQGGYEDWGVSQTYYAMYHSLLAILFRCGYESKNHECTITAVEYLQEQRIIAIDTQHLAFMRTTKQLTTSDAKSLREQFQYGTQTHVNKEILGELLYKAKNMLADVEITLNNIDITQ
jgi:uncharacterized protein (UPF0332 family)